MQKGSGPNPTFYLGVVAWALMPALGRQRQVDLWEFEASLVSRISFRIPGATLRNPVLLVVSRKPMKQNKTKKSNTP